MLCHDENPKRVIKLKNLSFLTTEYVAECVNIKGFGDTTSVTNKLTAERLNIVINDPEFLIR